MLPSLSAEGACSADESSLADAPRMRVFQCQTSAALQATLATPSKSSLKQEDVVFPSSTVIVPAPQKGTIAGQAVRAPPRAERDAAGSSCGFANARDFDGHALMKEGVSDSLQRLARTGCTARSKDKRFGAAINQIAFLDFVR